MKPDLKQRILQYNRERARDREMAEDLLRLLSKLPPGQLKQLLKDEQCRAILEKYGFGEE